MREWLARGDPLLAFAHPLYAEGDPRAVELLAHFELRPVFAELRSVVESLTGEYPNIEFAIAATAEAYHLPPTAHCTIHNIRDRTVGRLDNPHPGSDDDREPDSASSPIRGTAAARITAAANRAKKPWNITLRNLCFGGEYSRIPDLTGSVVGRTVSGVASRAP